MSGEDEDEDESNDGFLIYDHKTALEKFYGHVIGENNPYII